MKNYKHWVEELRRRKVLRVAVAYLAIAWLLIQVAGATFEPMGLPGWSLKLVIVLVSLGFPLACVLAWAYDINPTGQVTPAQPALPNDAAQRAAVEIPTASARSVAILPFVNISNDPEQDYFCDGIAEEIINTLGCVRGLRVASRTSSFQFRGHGGDVRDIGQRLGVGSVLEGSVRKSGDRVRISVQLLNAVEGYSLWSHGYERTLDNIFAIQTDIANSLVEALQVTLNPGEQALLGRGGTSNAQAYDSFLRGQQQLRAFGDGMLAADLFRRAIACDEGFAQAHAGLASALAQKGNSYIHMTPEDFEEAFAASRRALALEPWMPEAYLARAQLRAKLGRYDEAEADFREAIRLNPTHYFTYYTFGRHCLGTGRTEQAIDLLRHAARLAPTEYTPLGMLFFAMRKLGETGETREIALRALQLIETHLLSNPEDEMALGRGAIISAHLRLRDQAADLAERAVRTRAESHGGLYNAACAFAILGNQDRAIDLLEQAVRYGRGNLTWMENDEDLSTLRQNPRFIAIIERIRARSAQAAG